MLKVIHYCKLIHLTSFGICDFEIYGFDPPHFLSVPELAWQAAGKKQK